MKRYPVLSLISYIGMQSPWFPAAFTDVVLCCLAPTCAIRGGFHPLLWACTSASHCAPAASIGTLLQACRGRRPGRSSQAQQAHEGFEGLSCYLGQRVALPLQGGRSGLAGNSWRGCGRTWEAGSSGKTGHWLHGSSSINSTLKIAMSWYFCNATPALVFRQVLNFLLTLLDPAPSHRY